MRHSNMNWLYPQFPIKQLPAMFRIALLGAAVAGTYGAIHDQISYAISPEYFTKMKFRQFSYADFGWHPRLFAAEVGFLATWWVGMFAGWILARYGLAEMPPSIRRPYLIRAFAIMIAVTALNGLIGALIGCVVPSRGDLSDWKDYEQLLKIKDMEGFVVVAYLHLAGYIGALLGLIASTLYVRRLAQRLRETQ